MTAIIWQHRLMATVDQLKNLHLGLIHVLMWAAHWEYKTNPVLQHPFRGLPVDRAIASRCHNHDQYNRSHQDAVA